jgi:hypothetical protein
MRRALTFLFGVLLVGTLQLAAGCSKEKKPATTGSTGGDTDKEETKTALEAKGWATIKGKVVLDGDPPAPTVPAGIKEHAECMKEAPEEDKIDQTWLVGPDKGVANVVVWVEPPKSKYFKLKKGDEDRKSEVIKLHQPHCAFHPRVLALFPSFFDGTDQKPTGQKLVVENDAPFPHNTQIEGDPLKNPTFDTGQMPGASGGKVVKKEVPDRQPQDTPLNVKCNIHQWMKGKIWVFDNPYHAVTKKDGLFEIKNVPAGAKLHLVVWHEGAQFVPSREGEEITLMEGVNERPTIKLTPK